MAVVEISKLINPTFYEVWLADQPHNILEGGRSSMKSSVISLKLVTDFLGDPLGNVVCLRKVGKYLSGSVYEQIKWAIYKLGVQDQFFFGRSPLVIMHKETGTGFYFAGVDDPQKLKSMNIAVGYYMALWFEELAEFSGVEDIDIVEDTFIRQNLGEKQVRVYYSFNPPANPYAWVNQWVDSKREDPDYLVHHSTYEDDEHGFLSPQMVRKILKYRENDPEYYRWMYRGEQVGLGTTIYKLNLFKPIEHVPEDDPIVVLDVATDGGHMNSATTHLLIGLTTKGKIIVLDTYYYSPAKKVNKKAPSELSADYMVWLKEGYQKYKRPLDTRVIDSAEGALRNQIWKDHRIRLQPAPKRSKIDMIEMVRDLLAQGRIYYLNTPNNQIFIEEHKKYQWDPKSIKKDPENPKVIKQDDHTCDAFQYYVVANKRKLGFN